MITEIIKHFPGYPDYTILFTEDEAIFNKFRESPKCLKALPYMGMREGKSIFVGGDLYFKKQDKKWLQEKLWNEGY